MAWWAGFTTIPEGFRVEWLRLRLWLWLQRSRLPGRPKGCLLLLTIQKCLWVAGWGSHQGLSCASSTGPCTQHHQFNRISRTHSIIQRFKKCMLHRKRAL